MPSEQFSGNTSARSVIKAMYHHKRNYMTSIAFVVHDISLYN